MPMPRAPTLRYTVPLPLATATATAPVSTLAVPLCAHARFEVAPLQVLNELVALRLIYHLVAMQDA